MNQQIRPLGVLLLHLFGRRRKICPEELGKIGNHALAKETVNTYLNVILAIQKGEQYFELNGTSYMLPKDIPTKLMTVLPVYLDDDERKKFLEQQRTGDFELRGIKFHYQSRQISEQEKLEHEIERYITGGAFF